MVEALMREAIDLALASVQKGLGGPFGAVIAQNGRIVGQGPAKEMAADHRIVEAYLGTIAETAP